jgi:5,10-methylenetetrahydromethanopterin reductase
MFAGVKLAISIGISPRQSLASWTAMASDLERSGVDRLWLIDSQLAMKDAFAGLYLAAAATSRMELGTGVANPLTRHPTVTANAIAALSELSGGRALLGVGAGDSAVYGLGWKPARVAEVEEALRYFKSVLRGHQGELGGRTYSLAHVVPPVPVWLAASQRRMCTLAGQLCDGVVLMGPADPVFVRRQVDWVEAGIADAGRSREEIEIALMTTLSADDDDPASALDAVRSWASTEARLIADFVEFPPSLEPFRAEIINAKESYDYSQHLSTHADHQASVSDELTRTLAVAGTTRECAARLSGLLAAGVDSCIFPLLGGGRMERLRVLRESVLPAVRQ